MTETDGEAYRLVSAPLGMVVPGNNARAEFDEADLRDLAASLRDSGGSLQPARAWVGPDGRYVLVSGERRWRAHGLAGLTEMLIVVGPEPSEGEKLKWNLVENLQRVGLRPMECVRRVGLMLSLRDGASGLPLWSQASLAEELGKSVWWVATCVAAGAAPAVSLEALEAGAVSLDVVGLIGSLPESLRERAHGEMIARPFGGAMTVVEAQALVAESYRRDLRRADFDLEDGDLVRGCPKCSECPWNGGNRADVAGRHKRSVCLNPGCYDGKARAHAAKRRERESDTVGISMLEAGAAARLFQPWNQAVDPSSGYVDVLDRPDAYLLTESARLGDRDALPRWEALIDGAEVPLTIAMDGEGRERRLVEVKPATLAALRSKWAGLFKGGVDEGLLTQEEKKASAALRKGVDLARRVTLTEGMGEWLNGVAVLDHADAEVLEALLRLAIEGALQREDMAFVLGILSGDAGMKVSSDGLEDLIGAVREAAHRLGVGIWLAVLALVLRTRAIRYHGFDGADWEPGAPLSVLGALGGFPVGTWRDKLRRRVKAAEGRA